MGFVFISYSRQDDKKVDNIVSQLEDDGLEVWIDRESIKGGQLWTVAIVEAIDIADSFVLMLSPNSTASDNVRKELQLAQDARRSLFPLLLAAVILPAAFRYPLAGVQLIDYAGNPKAKYAELVESLKANRERLREAAPRKTREVEVVLGKEKFSKFTAKKREKLEDTTAKIAKTPRSMIKVKKVKGGSVHAFIEMPAHAAYVIKTAALNRDKQLLENGIDAIRLDGEENYVMVQTGEIGPLDLPKGPPSIFNGLLTSIIGIGILATLSLGLYPVLKPILQPSTPTATATATAPLTQTPSKTRTLVPTSSETSTPLNTDTSVPTLTGTATVTLTLSMTPSFTPTSTLTRTPVRPLTILRHWWSPSRTDNFTTTDLWGWTGWYCDPEFYLTDYEERPIMGRIFSPGAPQPPETIPLYTWYSCSRDDGYITTLWSGNVGDIRDGYQFVRLEGYIYASFVDGTVPLNSWWSPSSQDNFASTYWTGNIGDTKSPDYTLYRVEGYMYPP